MINSELTDYTTLHLLIKDFTPFYNLWNITNLWKSSYNKWLN